MVLSDRTAKHPPATAWSEASAVFIGIDLRTELARTGLTDT